MRQPNIKAYLTVSLDGKVVIRQRASRSFVKLIANGLYTIAAGGSNAQNDVGGVSRNINWSTNGQSGTGPQDSSTKGIVVGTGTTAVAPGDTKLVTQVVTGNGSGQLRYLLQQANIPTADSTTNSFNFTRTFINNSGATITITETGWYITDNGGAFTCCCIRDVLGTSVSVLANQTLTVTYTISATI